MRLPSRPWLIRYARVFGLAFSVTCLVLAVVLWLQQKRSVSTRPPDAANSFRFADGSRQAFPGNRFVALYGAPGEPVLGALGAQDPTASVARVKQLAEQYQPLNSEKIVPAFEIITTVAAAEPTSNNDHSRETEPANLQPWIDAAAAAGVYVILDLQPGNTPFDEQAQRYAGLLRQPHVGLALDPEWRLQPGKQHLQDIGSVSAEEVNRTATWLASLTRDNGLPQKLFLLHQFRLDMLQDRQKLDASHPELATIIQMDGQGTQEMKQRTYAAITAQAPAGVRFGWKNFYAKDTTVLTPAATMQQQPRPWLISYQ